MARYEETATAKSSSRGDASGSAILTKLEAVENSQSALDHVLVALAQKLDPVLLPEAPDRVSDVGLAREEESLVEEKLNLIDSRVQTHHRQVESLLARLRT